MQKLQQRIHEQLRTLKEQEHFRKLVTTDQLLDFASNDYLGFARSQSLSTAIANFIKSNASLNGATGSRLLSGNNVLTEETEAYLANLLETEKTLLFTSGYAANLSILSSLPLRGDTVLYDERVHASIKDGLRLSFASFHAFKHNDIDDLRKKLQRASGIVFIVAESIYSMDGDLANLTGLVAVANEFGAILIIDEAHATGVMGKSGGGLSMKLQLHHSIPIRVYTFGKAMGVHGACAAFNESFYNYIINKARPFIYTTALPPASVAGIRFAFELLLSDLSIQDTLLRKIGLFRNELHHDTCSQTAIQPVIIPGNQEVRQTAADLSHAGFDIRPIISPTVPAGQERLRISLHVHNRDEDILALCTKLNDLLDKRI